jgi:hypothetical protein
MRGRERERERERERGAVTGEEDSMKNEKTIKLEKKKRERNN